MKRSHSLTTRAWIFSREWGYTTLKWTWYIEFSYHAQVDLHSDNDVLRLASAANHLHWRMWRILLSQAGHSNFALDFSRGYFPRNGRGGKSHWMYITIDHNLTINYFHCTSAYHLLFIITCMLLPKCVFVKWFPSYKENPIYRRHGTGITSLQTRFYISLFLRTPLIQIRDCNAVISVPYHRCMVVFLLVLAPTARNLTRILPITTKSRDKTEKHVASK